MTIQENRQTCSRPMFCVSGAAGFAQSARSCIYLLVHDDQLAESLAGGLEKRSLPAQRFTTSAALEEACRMEQPAVILMDDILVEGETSYIGTLQNLAGFCKPLPSVICLAQRDDMEARLAAHRAGVLRYFVKPFDSARVIETLDVFALGQDKLPRILAVTETAGQAQRYGAMLETAGMEVYGTSDPHKAMQMLETFRPELVLLDVRLPGCSGLELAAIIRQDNRWVHLPIVFMTEEIEPDWYLAALRLGVDGFINQSVKSTELVDTLRARLKHARCVQYLDEDRCKALIESQALRAALDQHDIVSIADIAGTITHVNDKFCEASGYSREELIGRNHNMLNSGYHPRGYYNDLWQTLARGGVWRGELCNRRRGGGHYWVLSTLVPFLDAAGRPYQYVSLSTDITQLKVNGERLQRSQAFANIGTWDWNIETGEVCWSERVGPLFGCEEKVSETTHENFLAAVHPDDRQQVTDAINLCLQQHVEYNVEHRVLWPDGSVRWLLERGDVVRDKNGRPLRMLGVVQDITERKAAEMKLALAKEEAEKANRAKSRFLSSMSHELRTPMNAILGFSQLLEIEELTADQKESVEEISRAGRHLLELINEVLELSKIESGHIDLSIEPVELAPLFQECRALIGPLLARYQVSLLRPVEPCCKLMVKADSTRLKQALLNLLSNACKYNRTGGTVSIRCSAVEDGLVRVSVCDTGPGIPTELLDKLFQPFNRLGAESSTIEGTGIGLVITRQLVELMGGRVGVDSKVGEGSTFWIEIPLDERSRRPNIPVSCFAESPEVSVTHLHTVLYLEDNPANLRLVSRLLARRPQINLLTAHEPYLGLELAEARRPDLILLDINLPGMDGYEVLARLRNGEAGRSIPILAVSANAMPKDRERGLTAGFNAYLTKPLDVETFLREVDEHLLARI